MGLLFLKIIIILSRRRYSDAKNQKFLCFSFSQSDVYDNEAVNLFHCFYKIITNNEISKLKNSKLDI